MEIEKYGLPKNYKTWHEKIIDYFKENPKKWRTQKQIREGLNIKWVRPDQPDFYKFYDLNSRIRELLKEGFLIRAYAPEFLKVKARNIKYVYKWTGKEKKPNYYTSAIRLKKVNKKVVKT